MMLLLLCYFPFIVLLIAFSGTSIEKRSEAMNSRLTGSFFLDEWGEEKVGSILNRLLRIRREEDHRLGLNEDEKLFWITFGAREHIDQVDYIFFKKHA